MTLRSSLGHQQQLIDVDKNNTAIALGATGLGVLEVKKTLWEMGYRIIQNSGGKFFATFDQDLVDALKKFAETQKSAAGAEGKIDRQFLQALDRIMLGGDFNIPSYVPAPPGGQPAPGPEIAAAAKALVPKILDPLGDAAGIVQYAYFALERKLKGLPATTAGAGAKPATYADAYNAVATAFDHNFSFEKMRSDTERRNGLRKIAETLSKAMAYARDGGKNFMYAPPDVVKKHGLGAGAYAYYRPADKNIYFTDKFPTLGAGGRWRATTHELMHAAGIQHGTFAVAPPYWWNLDAYHSLSPAQRLNNADNYVWFVVYCLKPFGRKQPRR
jgi:hypothetical protein